MTLIRGGCYFYASLWIKVILIIKYDFCVCQIFHRPFNRNLLHDIRGLEFSHHYKMKGLGCLIIWYLSYDLWLKLQWILILYYVCIKLQSFLIIYVFEPTMTEIITKHFFEPYQTPHITIVVVVYEPKQHVYYLIKLSISKRNLLAIYFQGQDTWKEKITFGVSIVVLVISHSFQDQTQMKFSKYNVSQLFISIHKCNLIN